MERPEQFNFYTASPNGTESSSPSKEEGGKSNGAVIGGAVGGALGGVLIIGLIVFFFRRRRSQRTVHDEAVDVASPMMGGKAFHPSSPNFIAQSRECIHNTWYGNFTD